MSAENMEDAMKLAAMQPDELYREREERQARYQRLREEWTAAADRLADAEADVQRERSAIGDSHDRLKIAEAGGGNHRPCTCGDHPHAYAHALDEREQARDALEALKRQRGGTHPEQAGSSAVAAVDREYARRQAKGELNEEIRKLERRKRLIDQAAGVDSD